MIAEATELDVLAHELQVAKDREAACSRMGEYILAQQRAQTKEA